MEDNNLTRWKAYRCLIVDVKRETRAKCCVKGTSPEDAFKRLVKGKHNFHAMLGTYAGEDYIYAFLDGRDYYLYLDGTAIKQPSGTFTAFDIIGTLTTI